MNSGTPKLHHKGRPDQLLRDTEASAMLGIGRSTFHRWVYAGDFPQPVKVGGCTRWWKSEIEDHVAAISDARATACA
jgi:predicted DNA-binding transcriptional regulator AlpA